MLRRINAEFWSALSNSSSIRRSLSHFPRGSPESALPEGSSASPGYVGTSRKARFPHPWAGNSGWDPRLELGSSTRGVPRAPGPSTELEPVKKLYLGVPEISPIRAGLQKCLRKEQRRSQKSQDVKIHFWKSPQESHLSAFLVTLKVGD